MLGVLKDAVTKAVADHVRRGQDRIALVVDVAGVPVDIKRARAGSGVRLDLQDFAFAFEIDVFAGRNVAQGAGRGLSRELDHLQRG